MLHNIENKIINHCRSKWIGVARFAIFLVFFWFGALKVFGVSPASSLVQALFERTIPFMDFGTFLILFGLFECLIGILFLVKGAERYAIILLCIHLITTVMPLFLLMGETWSGFLIPTLEGQYIIKNILIVAAAMGIVAEMRSRED